MASPEVAASPLVSVIIAAFNARPWVCDAIDSVLAQHYTPIETIVIDDGSTDATGEMLRERYGSAVDYLYQANRGLSCARNVGILRARGEYVQLLDADDRLHVDKLRLQVQVFTEHPACDVVYSDFEEFADADPRTMNPSPAEFQRKSRAGDVLDGLLTGNFIFCAAPLVRRTALVDTGMFDGSLSACEDYDLWLRLAAGGAGFVFLDRVLAYYRLRPGSLSSARARQLDRTITVHRRVRRFARTLSWRQRRAARRYHGALHAELATVLRAEHREREAVGRVLAAIGCSPLDTWRIVAGVYRRKPDSGH